MGGLTAGSPFPAPVTAIAWRTAHVAAVNYLHWDHAFGFPMLTFDLEFPSNATQAVEWLAASQRPLLQEFGSLDDAALERPRRTNWGAEWPTRRISKTLIVEQVHHGTEISLLRDLYRNRATLGGNPDPIPESGRRRGDLPVYSVVGGN